MSNITGGENLIPDELVVIDVETTGLSSEKDEIVEVAAIKFNKHGEVLDKIHKFCKPMSGFIPIEASNIHGVTMDKVAGCPYYSEVRAELADFIGKRPLIGHNIVGFDIKFLKLQPAVMYDTLLMCREIWPGKNNLGAACKKMSIPFNKDEAHSAWYDTQKCMELYLALTGSKKVEEQPDMFSSSTPSSVAATQVYSYSRLKQFHDCPFKWKQVYLMKNKEPNRPYFIVGKTIHKIAEISAMWCYMRTFGNKFSVHVKKTGWKVPRELVKLIELDMPKNGLYLPKTLAELTNVHVGMFLYRNPGYISTYCGKTIVEMVDLLSSTIPDGEYEIVSRPDAETYAKIIQISMAMEKCVDPDCIKDVAWMSSFFYEQKSYAMSPGEVAIVEKQMIFDKDWNPLKDWFDNKGYMRGVIDVIEYNGNNHITIIDYKSSRTMLNESQLIHDLQLKIYVLFIHRYMPEITRITVKHHYTRYGKVVSVDITDVATTAMEAEAWVTATVDEIERELLKPDAESFKPCRNEHCSSCFLMENNACPLFRIRIENDINDPPNFQIRTIEDFKRAWKKIEINEAQNKGLKAKCKAFMKDCQGRVTIDEKASVDFWVSEKITYNPVETTKMLIDKGVKLSHILSMVSLSNTAMDKLKSRYKLDISEDEMNLITKKSTESEFKALTKEEVEKAGYLNA